MGSHPLSFVECVAVVFPVLGLNWLGWLSDSTGTGSWPEVGPAPWRKATSSGPPKRVEKGQLVLTGGLCRRAASYWSHGGLRTVSILYLDQGKALPLSWVWGTGDLDMAVLLVHTEDFIGFPWRKYLFSLRNFDTEPWTSANYSYKIRLAAWHVNTLLAILALGK